MDIYQKRSNWQKVIIVLGVIMLLVTIFYSNYLANQLEESENKNIAIYQEAIKQISNQNTDINADVSFLMSVIESFPLPSITDDGEGKLLGGNWGEERDTNQVFLAKKLKEFDSLNREPLDGYGYADKIYIFPSPTLTYIRYFPIVQIGLVTLFVVFGYFLFSASKRAEQNRVWAGMAKETAHQLGTPISAILAWIEHLRMTTEGNEEQQEILNELVKDVDRLELVADRFSKIGSAPALEKTDIYEEMTKVKEYMHRRSPKRISYVMPENSSESVYVMINQHLFDWVLENLFRNALDAMDGKGIITTNITPGEKEVIIDISDTGKGIASSKFNSVFQPGYSTKQRGWGLGLSLAKRIIEGYHKGKIFVKSSKLNEGTTFTIRLPRA